MTRVHNYFKHIFSNPAFPTPTRSPARFVTLLDGIILIIVGRVMRLIPVLFPASFWYVVYWLGGIGLIYVSIFNACRRRLLVVVALAAIPILARGIALLVFGDGAPATIVRGIVWVAFALHISMRLALWPALEAAPSDAD